MKNFILPLIFILTFGFYSKAQNHNLKGHVFDTTTSPLAFASVVLLNPNDSTLAFYGITNTSGEFEIKNIQPGNYLLQTAYLGFIPFYKNIQIPSENNEKLLIILKPALVNLKGVEITGERIPMLIKKDTIEYNASSFKTQENAAVEDLLRKLPGVEVDRAGNVKAQGENVQKVLVDGKEFFGNDPKIATKNLPADAIDKVQVFDKKSDQAEFTGINDGERTKTINLQLKDDKKAGYFGEISAGYGSDNRFKTNGNLYRFRPKSQFAALAMMNNVNEFGFSFSDYINFNGGLRGMSEGGSFSMRIDSRDNVPIDFGNQVTGLVASGAGGMNFSYEAKRNNRFTVSYIANGSEKKLDETKNTQNFTNQINYTQNNKLNELNNNFGHHFNTSWRNDIDSSKQITTSAQANLSNSKSNSKTLLNSYIDNVILNQQNSFAVDNFNSLNSNGKLSYLYKNKSNWPIFKLRLNGSYGTSLNKSDWENITRIFSQNNDVFSQQFQQNESSNYNYSAFTSITRKLGNGFYLEPEISLGSDFEKLNRKQGVEPNESIIIDSLSTEITRNYKWIKPGLNFKKSTDKVSFVLGLRAELAEMPVNEYQTELNNNTFNYLLPSLSWEYDYKTGKRVGVNYITNLNSPTIDQLNPVLNPNNPLVLSYGNSLLKPEYNHNLYLNWFWFDQFSSNSLYINAQGKVTQNKINWARTIYPDLSQEMRLTNVDYASRASLEASYSAPIRKLGISAEISFSEQYDEAINLVNNVKNINYTFSHEASLNLSNRKKEKWDINLGLTANFVNSRYSIQQALNNTFTTLTYFTEINFNPNKSWNFNFSADIMEYHSQSFGQQINVPLLKAKVSYFFLVNKRGTLTLSAFDLLNQNSGISRISELNYLQETQSNIIGRYIMLSFKFRINKTGNAPQGNIEIDMGR